jgi:hypothetical protein
MAAASPTSRAAKRRRQQKRNQTPSLWTRISSFDVAALFARKRPPLEARTIYVNQDLPKDAFDAKGRHTKSHIFATNQVITAKYTVITFLPRNLLEQFRRIANM